VWDDCFSFPTSWFRVSRAYRIRGAPIRISKVNAGVEVEPTRGVTQHEIDHLDGVLAVDRPWLIPSACGKSGTDSMGPIGRYGHRRRGQLHMPPG